MHTHKNSQIHTHMHTCTHTNTQIWTHSHLSSSWECLSLNVFSKSICSIDCVCVCVCVCVCSVMSNSLQPHRVACWAPLFTGFPRKEYWRGLPFLPPGDLSSPGTEPRSPALQAGSLLSELPRRWSPLIPFIACFCRCEYLGGTEDGF